MAHWYQYPDPNYYGLGMYNMEIAAETQQGVPEAAAEAAAVAAATGSHFHEGAVGFMEEVIQEDYLNYKGTVNQGGVLYHEAGGSNQQPT